MIKLFRLFFVLSVLIMVSGVTMAQSDANTITTAVPFLSITPDSRSGGMGDAGVASTPDVSSQHWNPAKYIFMESDMGVGLSYSPWLQNLVDDINLAYLTFYKKIDDMQSMSSSLRYFGLGEIHYTDNVGTETFTGRPNEFAIDFGYSRLLSESFSGAVVLRYIYSDLTNGAQTQEGDSKPGKAFATDVAFYYHKEFRANRKDNIFSAGINIQNIGSKISYNDGTTKDFIPTNLMLGAAYSTEVDDYNMFTFSFEANKLLVPTPQDKFLDEGDYVADGGANAEIGSIEGIVKSFSDAPGGAKEEFQEINFMGGVEYWYNKQFAIRGGYFYEHANKGNRKYFTAGAGLKMNVFALDFSYLFPFAQPNHPLENTLRFTLSFDVDAFKNQR